MTTITLDDEATHLQPFYARMAAFADRVIGGGPVFTPKYVEHRYVAPGFTLQDGVAARLREIYDIVSATDVKLRILD
jgi:hypothetical protein